MKFSHNPPKKNRYNKNNFFSHSTLHNKYENKNYQFFQWKLNWIGFSYAFMPFRVDRWKSHWKLNWKTEMEFVYFVFDFCCFVKGECLLVMWSVFFRILDIFRKLKKIRWRRHVLFRKLKNPMETPGNF